MALIQKNLREKTNDFGDVDDALAFKVWYVEKEFGFLVDKDFNYMKFLHLLDEKNINKYNDMQRRSREGKDGASNTLG